MCSTPKMHYAIARANSRIAGKRWSGTAFVSRFSKVHCLGAFIRFPPTLKRPSLRHGRRRSGGEKFVPAVTSVISFERYLQNAGRMHQLIRHSLFFSPRGSQTFIATARVIFSRRSVKREFHAGRTGKHFTPILKAIVLLLFVRAISLGHCRRADRSIRRSIGRSDRTDRN